MLGEGPISCESVFSFSPLNRAQPILGATPVRENQVAATFQPFQRPAAAHPPLYQEARAVCPIAQPSCHDNTPNAIYFSPLEEVPCTPWRGSRGRQVTRYGSVALALPLSSSWAVGAGVRNEDCDFFVEFQWRGGP